MRNKQTSKLRTLASSDPSSPVQFGHGRTSSDLKKAISSINLQPCSPPSFEH